MQNKKDTPVSDVMFPIIFLSLTLGLILGSVSYAAAYYLSVPVNVAILAGFLVGYFVFLTTFLAFTSGLMLAERIKHTSAEEASASRSTGETHVCHCGNRPDRGGGELHSSPNPSVRPDPADPTA